jgi:1,4-alpha-glucan branching enzyme
VTRFRVWARLARTVELALDAMRPPMTPGERGWWSAHVRHAGADADYAFAVRDQVHELAATETKEFALT